MTSTTKTCKLGTVVRPVIPETPSKTINDMLKQRCDRDFEHPLASYVANFVCLMFTAMTYVYGLINKDKTKHSYSMWCVACCSVSAVFVLACITVYTLIIWSSFVVHNLLFYTALVLCLLGIGLSVSGVLFFDKKGSDPSTSSSTTVKASYTSTHTSSTISSTDSAPSYQKQD